MTLPSTRTLVRFGFLGSPFGVSVLRTAIGAPGRGRDDAMWPNRTATDRPGD
jgi:hypothetical protein